ncbi:MAG: hypothetical protein Q4G35_03815 [Propionibacteriaceae bacterium]|nr:hypothetical protein [Propionibacteriaceae bacterium]
MDTETFNLALAAAEPVESRETRAIAWTIGAVVVAALLLLAAWQTSILRPGVELGSAAQSSADGNRVTISVDVSNTGWLAEQLTGFTAEAPWVEVVSARFEPEVLKPGQKGALHVVVDVTCNGGSSGPLSVTTLQTKRPWGSVSKLIIDDWGLFSGQPLEMGCRG